MVKKLLVILALLTILVNFLLISSTEAQISITDLSEIANRGPSLELQAFIFSDGSVFLQGQSAVDPDLPVKYEDGKISGLTNQLTSKKKEIWNFALSTDKVFDQLDVKIILPENAKLSGNISSKSVPFVYTQGKSLVIEVSDLQKDLDISFNYQVPLQRKENNPFVIVIYLIAVIVAVTIVFLILKKRKRQQKKKKKRKPKKSEKQTNLEEYKKKFETLKQTLNGREIKIIESLIELKGKAKQNQLQKFTGISKAAFSRHISALETKGLVEKKSLGRVNLIQIKTG